MQPKVYYVYQCFGTHTHTEDAALQTNTTGQNSLYAAEIFKILTCCEHPGRQARKAEQVSYELFFLLQGYLKSVEVLDKWYGITDIKASHKKP